MSLPGELLGDYRFRGNKHRGYDEFLAEYPDHCNYMKELHDKYDSWEKSAFACGAHFQMYHEIVRKIVENKCKHVIEYGAGFTTQLLEFTRANLDWEMEFYSYDMHQNYVDVLHAEGFDPRNRIEVTSYSVNCNYEDDTREIMYDHDLEKHKDVDYIILDGPDGNPKHDLNRTCKELTHLATLNPKALFEYTGRHFDFTIDGRWPERLYYTRYFKRIYGEDFDWGPPFLANWKDVKPA